MESNTNFRPIHQRLLHDKYGPVKNTLCIGQEVCDIAHLSVFGTEHGGFPYLIFITPLMDALCKGLPNS